MLTEVKYRTFEQLYESVKIDLRHIDLENLIEGQTLIKVAQRVSYDLGLKINPSRSKMLDVSDGKARLPMDFDVLNFALLCEEKTGMLDACGTNTYVEEILDELRIRQMIEADPCIQKYATFMDIVNGNNHVVHGLNSNDYIIQAFAPDGALLSFEIETVTANEIIIKSYNPTTIMNVHIVIFAVPTDYSNIEDAAATLCSSNGCTTVQCTTSDATYTYKQLIPLEIEKSKSTSVDCFNIQVRGKYKARLENGFFKCNIPYATVFINYQSTMEDNDGNLLVMDHPLINEFYEYALKQRIYEDLFAQGEPVQNMLQLVEARLRTARYQALSIINTPEFYELKKMWLANRKSQYYKYIDMFKS